MSRSLKIGLGALRILDQAVRKIGQPGMTLWTSAGEKALADAASEVRDLAHRNEVTEGNLAGQIRAMLADGKIDESELRALKAVPATLVRCSERSHDITEVVSL